MDAGEYDLSVFHRLEFHRRVCTSCGHPFWSQGDSKRCQEAPCTPISFIGNSGFRRRFTPREMREAYLSFFEKRGHTRLRRYPTVARWRNDVFFTQASIYDFQPWVTSGTIPPPANPLTISQPCLRFNDIHEVGHASQYFTEFEMMAHHAFNRTSHEVYFKDRTVELCHEWLTQELGAGPRAISYKEEVWEGGGNLGPSLSVGLAGLELATLVFMEYTKDGDSLRPMPLTVVDTGYGLERHTWMSHGTKSAYEAVFGETLEELRRSFSPADAAILIDHARSANFLLIDGVVPSNSKDGYFVRLVLRRMMRILRAQPESIQVTDLLDRVGREIARDFPEVGQHRDDLHRVVHAEVERYDEAIRRGRVSIERAEEKISGEGRTPTVENLVEWYDSLGVPPEIAVEFLTKPPTIPAEFYALVSAKHESERRETDYSETARGLPSIPDSVAETEAMYYLDPYTTSFEGHVLFVSGPFVVLDRTYFYPTGGGQVTDVGSLGDQQVVDVVRHGRWILHRLEGPSPLAVGNRVRGTVDRPRRLQLMQHHTATHLLNGALRELLGPHVWQAGAFKGMESARIDITHFRALTEKEVHEVSRRVNSIVREDRHVRSYFESRSEAEKRFGFTLYQGGAVPGRELRIVEVEGFDVEACGGTHCTHTSEVGLVTILGTERIQDGIVRLTFAAGERALDLVEERARLLEKTSHLLETRPEELPQRVERLVQEAHERRRADRKESDEDLKSLAERLLVDPDAARTVGSATVIRASVSLSRTDLQTLSRHLTRADGRVAILASEHSEDGVLFVGSSAPTVSALAVVEAVRHIFGAKGGGNPSAATAVGEPGTPLQDARRVAVEVAEQMAAGPRAS